MRHVPLLDLTSANSTLDGVDADPTEVSSSLNAGPLGLFRDVGPNAVGVELPQPPVAAGGQIALLRQVDGVMRLPV